MPITGLLDRIPLLIAGTALCFPFMFSNRKRISFSGYGQMLALSVISVLSGFVGVWFFAQFEGLLTGEQLAMRFHGIFFVEAPVMLAVLQFFPVNKGPFFDVLAIANIPTLIAGRLNCLRAGCDWGRVIPGTIFRVPTREVEIGFCILLFLYFIRLYKRGNHIGQLFPLLMITYGIFRFFWEGFYVVDKLLLGVHPAHIWSIICIIIGCSIYFEMQAQKDAKTKAKHRRV